MALRVVFAALFAGAAATTDAVVFTTDYDRLTVLPVLPGGPGGNVDWRTKGAITPVKNEGLCDASWAFAVTGLVEAWGQIHLGSLISLSEQELLDCAHSGSGCGGGSPIAALRTASTQGLTNEASYPYTAREGTCKAFTPVIKIPGAGRVPPGDEGSLQGYVSRGPVLALVNASAAFNAYHGGIFNGPCSNDNPTQAVLIAGYGTSINGDYWIVKNSLGTAWGSSGYIFLARGKNLCGIADFAIAISNDPLPPPIFNAPPIPTLSAWAVGFLVLGIAAVRFMILRRRA